jgi:hypothetical protein
LPASIDLGLRDSHSFVNVGDLLNFRKRSLWWGWLLSLSFLLSLASFGVGLTESSDGVE